MREERISQRVQVELPARFCFQDKPKAWIEADVMNISTHGFCFRTDARYAEKLNAKPVIRLAIVISEKETVEMDIKIAWGGRTSSYNCLAGGEIVSPLGPDYQRILELYTKLFRAKQA